MTSTALTLNPPDPPGHFNGDAVWQWRQAWPRLDHTRFSYDSGRDTLIAYCEAYAEMRHAQRMIDKVAETSKLKSGGVIPAQGSVKTNPFIEQRDTARERWLTLGKELGLTVEKKRERLSWFKDIVPILTAAEEEVPDDDEPIRTGAPGRPKFWTVERIMPALIAARGSPTVCAVLLGRAYPGRKPTRETICKMVAANPPLKEAAEKAKLAILDALDFDELADAAEGDPQARRFVLARRHPDYRQKQEVMGKDGTPIQVQAVAPEEVQPGDQVFDGVDETRLTRDEQIALAALAEKVDRLGALTHLSVEDFAALKALQDKGRTTIADQA